MKKLLFILLISLGFLQLFSLQNSFFNSQFYIDSLNCTKVGDWKSGKTFTVFSEDTFMFMGDGVYMRIYNINDPNNIIEISSIKTYGFVNKIIVSDTLVFIANGYRGLTTINIADMENPYILSNFDPAIYLNDDYFFDIEIVDTLIYVADKYKGLLVINISDPINPEIIGTYEILDESCNHVSISGSLLSLGFENSNAVYLFIITDPTNPVYANSFSGGEKSTIIGTLLYTISDSIFNVYDISDPLNIGFVNSYVLNSKTYDFYISDTIAYIADSSGMTILNISNVDSTIFVMDSLLIEDKKISVFSANNIAFMSSEMHGLNLIDISNLSDISLLNNIRTYMSMDEMKILNDTIMFIAGYNGMRILNIAKKDSVFLLADYKNNDYIRSVYVNDTICFAGSDVSLDIIDISDLKNPVTLRSENISNVYSLISQDSILYIGYIDGLLIYNISDLSSPQLIAQIDTSRIYDMEIIDSILYTNKFSINVSDPNNPIILDNYSDVNFSKISIVDSFLYLIDGYNIYRYNILDPANIVGTWLAFIDDYAMDIYCDENFIYLAMQCTGLNIYEYIDSLYLRGSYFTSDFTKSILYNDSLVYIGNYDTGIDIIRPYDLSLVKSNNKNSIDNIKIDKIIDNNIYIYANIDNSMNIHIKIFNVLGEKIMEKECILNDGENRIMLKNIKDGVYFIEVLLNNKILKTKSIKM